MADYNSYSDEELYLLLIKGELSAFNAIHKLYYGIFMRTPARYWQDSGKRTGAINMTYNPWLGTPSFVKKN